jgi:hypothetical protein
MDQHSSRPIARDTFSYLEFRDGSFEVIEAMALEDLLSQIRDMKTNSAVSGFCVVFEDITTDVAVQFASLLEIEPQFFQDHLVKNSTHCLDAKTRSKAGSLCHHQTTQ